MKKILIWAFVIVLLVAGFYVLNSYIHLVNNAKHADQATVASYKDAWYVVGGGEVNLVKGEAEIEGAPGSASKIVTKYFGNEITHDLNDDGREDVAFILTQETGGSGKFYWLVAALNTPNGYVGSHGFFLGDRIAPQSTSIDEGMTSKGTQRHNVIVVNYVTRLPNEPFTATPSVSKSVWLKLDPTTMQFGEVEQNFEGESR